MAAPRKLRGRFALAVVPVPSQPAPFLAGAELRQVGLGHGLGAFPRSVATWATYQSTSPSSARMASRASSLRRPPWSRRTFFTLLASSPASPARPRAG